MIKGSAISIFGIALGAVGCSGALFAGPAAAAPCPNEALRVGPSALLPECRAYEMVSPPNKGDGFVLRLYADQSDVTGDRIAFLSTAAFGEAEAAPSLGVYLARRNGSVGWSTTSVDPPTLNSLGLMEIASTALSQDLNETLQTSYVGAPPGATEGHSNVYLRNNLTGARTLIASGPGYELFFAFEYGNAYAGGSSDWSHLVLNSAEPLIEGVAPGASNIYDYTGGHFVVIDRLPNGEIPPQGANVPVAREGAVSDDGSRVYFTLGSSSEGPLYLREDDRTTVPISISQKEGPEEGEVAVANFLGASGDGSIAYFTARANLTDASHSNGSESLYRFDLANGKITDLTASAQAGSEGGSLSRYGVSDDGSFVYFGARNVMAPGATVAPLGGMNLYVWHDGIISFIAQTSQVTQFSGDPNRTIVSPNGKYLAFVTQAPITASDVPSPNCVGTEVPEHCAQVFDYEYATGQVTCVSCNGPARGESDLGSEGKISQHSARAVLDNGSVIFDTPNPLVSKDSNGIDDVYLWRDGATNLISTGVSDQPSVFADATADGSNVFIRTDQRLVGIDTDSATDLYDAKVDGGLAAQNPPGSTLPCEGEACRGLSPLPPPSPALSAAPRHGSSCTRLARHAQRAAALAVRAGRRAKAAPGGDAGRLRRIASRLHAEARCAHMRASRCRRAGR